MRSILPAFLAFGLVSMLATPTVSARQDTVKPPEGFTALFNGADLAGWHGMPTYSTVKLADMPETERAPLLAKWLGEVKQHWSVKDEAISGTTSKDPPLKTNTFLIWRDGTVGDFELKAKFRMEGGNSGIQYRSRQLDKAGPFVVAGYQEDRTRQGTYLKVEQKTVKFIAMPKVVRTAVSARP